MYMPNSRSVEVQFSQKKCINWLTQFVWFENNSISSINMNIVHV